MENKKKVTKESKAKKFVKKHGWKIALGTVVVGGAIIFAGKTRKTGKKIEWMDLQLNGNVRDLEKPNTDLGNIMDLWIEKDHGEDTLNTIISDVDLNDLGFLAADIADKTFDKYPETKGMTRVDAVLTFWRKPEEKLVPVTVVCEDSLEKTLETIAELEKERKKA